QQIEARPTENLAAYEYYLRARVEHDFDTSVVLLQRAVELDPTFAAAWAALADWWMEWTFARGHPELRDKAIDALDRATQLAPDGFETHMARAGYHFILTQNLDRALEHVEAARRLGPSDVNVPILEGSIHWFTGRWDRSLATFERAASLDPLSGIVACKLGQTHQLLGDPGEAERFFDRAIALGASGGIGVTATQCGGSFVYNRKFNLLVNVGDTGRAREFAEQHPDLSGPWLAQLAYLGRDYEQALRRYEALGAGGGNTYRAMHELDRVRAIAQSLAPVWEGRLREAIKAQAGPSTIAYDHAGLARQYADLGDRATAIKHAELALETYSVAADAFNYPGVLSNVASVYVILGDHDRAVDLLEKRLSVPGGGTAAILQLDPFYDPLRKDPRFQALLVKYANPEPVR
ncbi:MAG: tetratricopeptide repeat protein, partial [Gemmatimonadota bacterium]|nr:tetratricopeptide repeat protein [Gemmatimonadota bacterium]